KGGLIVDLGLRSFLPASQVDLRPVRDLGEFVGEALKLKVIEIDRSRRKVVLSRRKVMEEERLTQKSKVLENIFEGMICEGTVARVTDFGAFVNLGGIDGLVHISELSWRRIKHPSEVVKIGDKLEVLVLKIDSKKERISLSLRQARPDPWFDVHEKFHEGEICRGTVTKLAKNYTFVELAEGIEGLIPMVELMEGKIVKPEDFLAVGQELNVKVLEIKPSERRIILSLRQAESEKAKEEYSNYLNQGGTGTFKLEELLKKGEESTKTE
ncbi:MAG: S1 RNA-binding domain-containing protein, partial [Firmicutes bacterium]|nr:S1 RNA-binding domain-containing protein [Bacillota bacterium]